MFKPKSTYNAYRTNYTLPQWQRAQRPRLRPTMPRRTTVIRLLLVLGILGVIIHQYASRTTSQQLSYHNTHHGIPLRSFDGSQLRDGMISRSPEVSRSVVEPKVEDTNSTNQTPVAAPREIPEVHAEGPAMVAEDGKLPKEPARPVGFEEMASKRLDDLQRFLKEKSDKIAAPHFGSAVEETDSAREAEILTPQTKTLGEPVRFPSYSDYVELEDRAEPLPDVIHLPVEDSTADVALEGWEDLWFSKCELDVAKYGNLTEPKIDFVYTWVNGSDTAFQDTILPYEINSTLNDDEGKWIESHRVNRYRDWDELRYSMRTVEQFAGSFRNKYQLLVNAVGDPAEAANASVENPAKIVGRQRPLWLKDNNDTDDIVQVLSQEDFFDEHEQGCLPSFNSLTIENQLYNTKSDTDRIYALSDDMLLGKPHAASDIYSPLFGPTMGFKSNSYNTIHPPTDVDARRFGEKPFLIYTSWLLNRRFGERKRKGQIHFGHSLGRAVYKEAQMSFPRPRLQSACQRFRGETGFQLYSWFIAFHYTIERHREALLWSYLMVRADKNGDGNLDWDERQTVMDEIEEGMNNEGQPGYRKRMFFAIQESLEAVGLEAPKVNVDVTWTSLDGPAAINKLECFEFNVNECLAPGFSGSTSDEHHANPVFSTANIFDYATRQKTKCGDCLAKLLLNRAEKGLEPMLPLADTQAEMREVAIKALSKYQYSMMDPDAYFVMVTDAEQVENVLWKRLIKKKGKVGQLCLNDDVNSQEPEAIAAVRKIMTRLLHELAPNPTDFEADADAVAQWVEENTPAKPAKKKKGKKGKKVQPSNTTAEAVDSWAATVNGDE